MPYGFPSGSTLVTRVIRSLTIDSIANQTPWLLDFGQVWGEGNKVFEAAFRQRFPLPALLLDLGYERSQIRSFSQELHDSQLFSVDAFLERRSEYLEIGKAAIAYELLKCEKAWERDVEDNWYKILWNELVTTQERFKENKIAVVTYNYDRSLEHFLSRAAMATFGQDSEAAARLLSSIDVIHLHGSLGSLEWQDQTSNVQFGLQSNSSQSLKKSIDSMIVIHEGKDDSAEYERARLLIREAKRVLILGFGFGEVNLRRLQLNRVVRGVPFFATQVGLTDQAMKKAQKLSGLRLRYISAKGCSDFLGKVPLD